MSFLNKIKSAADWLLANESAIHVTIDIHKTHSQAMLKDLVNLCRVVTQPKEFPKVNEVVEFIKPLLPSKREIVDNLFSNTLKTEEKILLTSQLIQFLVHCPNVTIMSLDLVDCFFLKAEIKIKNEILSVDTGMCHINCLHVQGKQLVVTLKDIKSFAAFVDSLAKKEIKKETEADAFWTETPKKIKLNNNHNNHNKHDEYPDAYDNVMS